MDGAMTLNGESQVVINDKVYNARVSAAFKASAEGLYSGTLYVDQFNFVIFDLPQEEISGRKAIGRKTGTLGFSVSGESQRVTYDQLTQTVKGKLVGIVNIPGYIDPDPKPLDRQHKHGAHLFGAPTQQARLNLSFRVEKDLQELIGRDGQVDFDGDLKLDMDVGSLEELKIPGYGITMKPTRVAVDFGWAFVEIARRLCVQPVRIGRFSQRPWPPYFMIRLSGDGLPFGKPGADTEWKKADLIFNWKAWQTVFANDLFEFSQSEASDLRATFDDPQCVEVFFVDSFSPSPFWGGGASFDSGTASAQIISTDENADFGVDLTHLAHELGHAVSLCHPSDSYCEARPEMNPASTGTLMCPSGFNNDNPTINSVENENNINNPLMTFGLKIVSAGPDCTNDADCGICP
jgi:hypothetical protein